MASDKDDVNPYKPPKAKERPAKRVKRARTDDSTEDDIAAIVTAFEKTRPWVTFFTVMTYIGAGGLFLGGIGALVAASATTGAFASLGPGVVILYLGLAVIYLLIGQRLGRYRNSIRTVSSSEGRLDAIVDAVEKQQKLWSFIGYLTVIIMGLYAFGILAYVMLLRR